MRRSLVALQTLTKNLAKKEKKKRLKIEVGSITYEVHFISEFFWAAFIISKRVPVHVYNAFSGPFIQTTHPEIPLDRLQMYVGLR